MKRFKTKTVVITGAGGGFGRGLAFDFSRMGWRVAVADIDLERAEQTVQLMDGSCRGRAIRCDVTRPDDMQPLANMVIPET